MSKPGSILYLLPVAYVQKPDEPGFQVQTLNFRTAFGFVLPELKKRNMEVTLVSLNNNERQLGYGKEYIKHAGQELSCRAFFFKRKAGRGRFFPQLAQFILNLKQISGVMNSVKPEIVYGYNDVGTLYGIFLKMFFRFRLVYDMRGDRVNEMAVQGAPGWRVRLYRFIRNLCLKKSDLVFTVSDTCKDLPKGKQHVPKYNFYDAGNFFFDETVARDMRAELGLTGRFVLVYSGTDKYYQMVSEMVNFFAGFLILCPDAYFMINLPTRSEKFLEELNKYQIPEESYGILHLDQVKLNRHQMVADLALLVRQDLPLNHEAFPTKFSEYLASGVPVLITSHVHTLERMVRENCLGEIWHEQEKKEELYQRILHFRERQDVKNRCAAFARKELSWQNKAPWLAEILKSV
jgi:glycosyltransferase involved in cell wall biosynthesis